MELSVENELLEDTAQDDSDGEDSVVREAYHAGWRAKLRTVDIRKARGFQ